LTTSAPLIRIGTRASQLALWQAREVATRLELAGFSTELVPITTKGDQVLDRSLDKIGSKGVFTEELEQSLRDGETQLAVHSAKDLPSTLPADLELLAFMEREKVNDVVLSLDPNFRMDQPQAIIGTSSTRRKALLKRYYPHSISVEARGNLQTRLEKLKRGDFQALLLAYAGVHRMEFDEYITAIIPEQEFVPAVGQGSVAVQCATSLDQELKTAIANVLDHTPTRACLTAERAFLRSLEGGCSIPVFGLATIKGYQLELTGGIISLDGKELITETMSAPIDAAEALGFKLGALVLDEGADRILREIRGT
jgi:hydroxymethylbilane synthase